MGFWTTPQGAELKHRKEEAALRSMQAHPLPEYPKGGASDNPGPSKMNSLTQMSIRRKLLRRKKSTEMATITCEDVASGSLIQTLPRSTQVRRTMVAARRSAARSTRAKKNMKRQRAILKRMHKMFSSDRSIPPTQHENKRSAFICNT